MTELDPPPPSPGHDDQRPQSGRGLQTQGLLLFAFIPAVLFLFVVHPEPLALSLLLGVALMLGHRFLARPYMLRSLPRKCVWCNRRVDGQRLRGQPVVVLPLETAGGILQARCCPEHRDPAARFFAFLHGWRWVLRVGIFVPLLALLGALAAASLGHAPPLAAVTAGFRLVIGVTVNLAALGYLFARAEAPIAVPFPVHNFFLLGVRNLLWIFRLVGLWWIFQGGRGML